MIDHDARLAFAHAYRVLARFFGEGLTPEVQADLREAGLIEDNLIVDADEAAARYQALLGFDVLPYASVFLSEDGQLGGPIEQAIRLTMHEAGLQLTGHAIDMPDHLSALLGVLSQLTGSETADAIHPTLDAISQTLVSDFLLPWLPLFVGTLQRASAHHYQELAELALELTIHHHLTLPAHPEPSSFLLPSLPTFQPESVPNFRALANFLSRPALCGVYLSRSDLSMLSATERLPQGFGDRSRQLTNMLTAAYRFDALPNLLGNITAILNKQEAAFAALADETPVLEHIKTIWLERIRTSRTALQEVLS